MNGPAQLNSKPAHTDTVVCTAIGMFVAVIFVYALAMYFFVPRGSGIDELGLFNPVYMKLHYGRMTYPIYGHFGSMFVHPPVRYMEVAALMRMGMPLPYAEQFVACLLTLCIALGVALSKLDYFSRLSLLFGFFAALTWMGAIDDRLYTLRPDTQLALAWFLGLVLLQDGALRDWNAPRLFLGSFLLTYASGLHYYAVVSFLGVLYYIFDARRHLSHERFRKAVAALVGGGCLFGVPYLIFFVIPNWRNILQFSHQVQSAGNWLSPLTRHYAQYAFWRSWIPQSAVRMPAYKLLTPVLYLKVPLFLVGAVLLMLKRDLRGFTVASLPMMLFVFAYSQGKSAGYYMPEIMIYFAGSGMAIILVLRMLARRWKQPVANAGVAIVFIAAACWATEGGYHEYAAFLSTGGPLIAPMDIARACARQLVGPDAFIGGRIGLWYISGARYWHDVAPDLLWRTDISDINLLQYFSKLDYVVEHNHMSYTTVNSSLESIPSWYVSGLLKLYGFVFNDQNNAMNVLIFNTTGSVKPAGYIVDRDRVYRFDEDPAGDFVFGSRLCQFDSWPPVDRFNLAHFNAIYLPKRSANDPSRSYLPEPKPGDAQSAVVTFVISRQEFESRRQALDAACRPLSTVRGSLKQVDLRQLLAQWRAHEKRMQFYRSIDDRLIPKVETEVVPLRSFDLRHLTLAYDKAKIEGDGVKRVTTAAQPYSFAAAVEIPPDQVPEPAWIVVRLRTIKGQIGIGVLDKQKNDFIARRFIDRDNLIRPIYLPLHSSAGSKMLIVENGDSREPSEVEIEDLRVVCAVPPHKMQDK